MRRANTIDIQALHLQEVSLYLLFRQGASAVLAEAMTVHSVEDDAVAIDQQGTISTNADCAQAYLQRTDIRDLTILLQVKHQIIKLWTFCTPGCNATDAR